MALLSAKFGTLVKMLPHCPSERYTDLRFINLVQDITEPTITSMLQSFFVGIVDSRDKIELIISFI